MLQNENGPCPLLAAANALLLRGVVTLDPVCVRNGVASTDDVVNMLANRALLGGDRAEETKASGNDGAGAEYHLNEVLGLLPGLQHGMDVNPRFTAGPTGVEYTRNLAAFDLLGVEMVHGWLLDEQDVETVSVVGNKTYNEVIETVIQGNEAREELKGVESRLREGESILEKGWMVESRETEVDGDCVVGSDNMNADDTEVEGETQSSHALPDEKVAENDGASKQEPPPAIPDKKQTENVGASNAEHATVSPVGDESHEHCSGNSQAEKSSPDNKEAENESKVPNAPKQQKKMLTVEEKDALRKDIFDAREKITELSLQVTRAAVANAFLTSSGHQLTYHGLEQLHKHMGDDTLRVFFRNNHFATITKHGGILYLLATDLGYANTPEIVWEKLDDIDGDTEYVNEFYGKPTPRTELAPAPGPTIAPELLLAQRGQAETDYQLALAMSKGTATAARTDDDEGRLVEAAKELSLRAYHGDDGAADGSHVGSDAEAAAAYRRAQERSEHDSEQLARQLQELEYARQRPAASARERAARASPPAKAAATTSNCTIS